MVPKQIHHGNSITGSQLRLRVEFAAEDSGDLVRQAAQNCDDNEADDHRENVAEIVAARFVNIPQRKTPSSEP